MKKKLSSFYFGADSSVSIIHKSLSVAIFLKLLYVRQDKIHSVLPTVGNATTLMIMYAGLCILLPTIDNHYGPPVT